MKKFLYGAALVVPVLTTLVLDSTASAQIGPDAFGYTAMNVNSAFEDISATGTQTLFGCDDCTWSAGMGFSFSFYGTTYNTAFWDSNGFITFGSSFSQYTNENFATGDGPGNRATIAPLWDDWRSLVPGSGVYYQTLGAAPDRRFIVQWNMQDHYPSSPSEVTFQAVLFEGTGAILFRYLDVVTADSNNNGASATVGIRNVNGQITGEFLQWSLNSAVIGNGQAICFSSNPDFDNDGVLNQNDNCPMTANADQADGDGDGNGDACDLCPGFDDFEDGDGDSVPDGCDLCEGNDAFGDSDGDGVCDDLDACPGFDDFADADGDGLPDECDNCPSISNPDQSDCDDNGIGDVCDEGILSDNFEDGDLNGWDVLGNASVIGTLGGSPPTPPAQGSFHALLNADTTVTDSQIEAFLGIATGTLDALPKVGPQQNATEGSAMRRTFAVNAGDTISFSWNHMTNDGVFDGVFNDFSFVTISCDGTLLLADSFYPGGFTTHGPPFNWRTGYQSFSYTCAVGGNVTLGLGTMDARDGLVSPGLLIDCVQVTGGAPPENEAPTCTVDTTLAEAEFLSNEEDSFVVTEGATINVVFTGSDADGDLLTAAVSGLPGATLTDDSGPQPLMTTLSWTPSAADKTGAPYTATVTFTDPSGESVSCSFVIEDVNLAPVCSVESDEGVVTAECDEGLTATVTLVGSATDDDDEDLSFTWAVPETVEFEEGDELQSSFTAVFPLGTTVATLCVADGRGGIDFCSVSVFVQDTTPPAVTLLASPLTLWPPNHKMVEISMIVDATDTCADPEFIFPIVVTVLSSEKDNANGHGDGNTTEDVKYVDRTTGELVEADAHTSALDVTNAFEYDPELQRYVGSVLVRAERDGDGDGRRYTVWAIAFDSEGNAAETSTVILVPHDRRPED